MQNLCNCVIPARGLNVLRDLTLSVAFYRKFSILAIFKNFKFFFRKTHFFLQKPKFWKFWEILLFQSHSTSNWLILFVFKNSGSIFEKIIYFLKTSKNPTDSFDSAATLLPLSIEQKSSRYSLENPIFFFLKKTNFEPFEKSYCFSRIRHQIG